MLTVLAAGLLFAAVSARAVEVELLGGGDDRLERQKAFARRELPLPGTPDLSKLKERMDAVGVKLGDAIFLRIFKAESELELWMRKGDKFVLFATYPICQWSGVLGPKFYEGDNQSPEGFYTVTRRQMNWRSRHRRAFNLNYPNLLDKALGRTGSYILVHGGCSTEGCFAMTNEVIDEIFRIGIAAFDGGQKQFHVQVLPFRLEIGNVLKHAASPWYPFWLNLKTGYDLFQDTNVPPVVRVCRNRYAFEQGDPLSNGEAIEMADCDPSVSGVDGSTLRFAGTDALVSERVKAAAVELKTLATARLAMKAARRGVLTTLNARKPVEIPEVDHAQQSALANVLPVSPRKVAVAPPPCSLNLASCRKFVALKHLRDSRATQQASEKKKSKVAKLR
jgi:murein L,D-transpeptidase YafK